jgi:hypothetical protein
VPANLDRIGSALEYFPIDDNAFVGKNIIPPGGEMTKGTARIPIVEFTNLLTTKKQFYTWGAIHYDDGFGVVRTITMKQINV